MKKKLVTIAIIALFLGLAVSPCIHADIDRDSELVEITTEFCGLDRSPHKVKLTREQAEELDRYFNSIKEQMNEAATIEETIQIFNNAIVELDKYGLISPVMSIEDAQRLVLGVYQNVDVIKFVERLGIGSKLVWDDANYFCLLAGSTNSLFYGPIVRTLNLVTFPFFWFFIVTPVTILVFYLVAVTSMNSSIPIFYTITYGAKGGFGGHSPAEGWVSTTGLLGRKTWNGTFYGRLIRLPLFLYIAMGVVGVTGFTGIKLVEQTEPYDCKYFGFALCTRLSSEPPRWVPW